MKDSDVCMISNCQILYFMFIGDCIICGWVLIVKLVFQKSFLKKVDHPINSYFIFLNDLNQNYFNIH